MDLPLHPLVVHAVVVFVPVFFIGMVAVMAVARWRERFGTVVAAIGVVAALAAVVAKYAGGMLASELGGVPKQHASVGAYVMYAAVVAGILGVAWRLLAGRDAQAKVARIVGWLTVLVAAIATVCTVIAGHTGAQAVWNQRLEPAPQTSQTSAPSADAAGKTYTAAEVSAHASSDDCWTIIDGGVYDLTKWIAKHPGGPDAIRSTCGVDASTAFNSKHGKSEKVAERLKDFAIGTLAD
ncbi:hypothetical protein H8R18_04905 [Nanchangia anserum]|uniref:Cytochrome b5 heme-binding domain-containing protein n=1 Tax=Nanchangia anserum TaxID=2692125 RepID=A0A8I0G6U9_9ACTO|nr:cytochrome b5-like heme/steroid binding domain-containing protein [Nanchangia anserum]MBD3688890.1 hypothetical protein [Nanchangia anserum]QOX81156.1 hypothetical protein H8R18_04905 [Nanchangia anserum]